MTSTNSRLCQVKEDMDSIQHILKADKIEYKCVSSSDIASYAFIFKRNEEILDVAYIEVPFNTASPIYQKLSAKGIMSVKNNYFVPIINYIFKCYENALIRKLNYFNELIEKL